jgi:glucosamine kinase
MSAAIYSIGVDLGGTWIRLEAIDASGRPVRSLRAAAPPVPDLPRFLKQRFRAWKAKPDRLNIASRGIWTTAERHELKKGLRSLARQVNVISDVEGAWHAAFDFKGEGILVIAGTGSIAYGRDRKGHSRRAGGWGPLLGDEGSGFWIGRLWLKLTHRDGFTPDILRLARHPHEAVRHVAALAPRILMSARRGQKAARQVLNEAHARLAALAVHAADGLEIKQPIPLSWGGRLMEDRHFREGFLSALRKSGRKFRPVPPGPPTAQAMARYV